MSNRWVVLFAVLALGNTLNAAAEETKTLQLDVAGQPLSSSLRQVAEEFDLTIAYYSESTKGLRAPELDGTYTSTTALDTLLTDTDLEYAYISDTSVAVRPKRQKASEERGDSDSKNSSPTRVLMAQAATRALRTSRNDKQGAGQGAFSGRVFDSLSGSVLAGALVRIVETGQSTKTDKAGRFSFPGVNAGNHTVYVSFLGFPSMTRKVAVKEGENVDTDIGLGQFDEIVVTGARSAQALALNQERTASNSATIVSTDTLGNFAGTTLPEALRRVAGVSFIRNQNTGEGTDIIIRGMPSDMNEVLLNGATLPAADRSGRVPTLNLLTDSIAKVTIHKTLLPSHVSGGTGGLVEIETKTPLDQPERFASFAVEGGRTAGDFREDRQIFASLNGHFGREENFGLGASFQRREHDITKVGYSTNLLYGRYLPLGRDGEPVRGISFVDPTVFFPFESGGGAAVYPANSRTRYTRINSLDTALTLSAEWQIAQHTNLNASYQISEGEEESFDRVVRFRPGTSYQLQPVQELGGEERYVLTDNGTFSASHGYNYDPDNSTKIEHITLRGQTTLNRWTVDYSLGFSDGESSGRNSRNFSIASDDRALDPVFLLPEALDPVEGRVLSPYASVDGPGFPLPLLTDAGWDFVNDPSAATLSIFCCGVSGFTRNDRRNEASFDVKYEFDHPHLKYIQSGMRWLDLRKGQGASFSASFTPQFTFPFPEIDIADLGMSLSDTNLSSIGIPDGFNVVSEGEMIAFMNSFETRAASDPDTFSFDEREDNPLRKDQFTAEETLSTYVEIGAEFGKFEINGGFRYNQVDITAANIRSPRARDVTGFPIREVEDLFTELLFERATVNEFLPRFLFNFRQTDNLIFRLGYYGTVQRPTLRQLSTGQSVSLFLEPRSGPDFNQPLMNIREGNPDLAPAKTDNYDLSVDYYHDRIGVMKLSVFYKETDNLVETVLSTAFDSVDGVELPDHPVFQNLPDNLFVVGTRPENSPHAARLWGYEARVERQLTFLPGAWNGLGVIGSFSYTDSRKRSLIDFFNSPVFDENGSVTGFERKALEFDLPYQGSPKRVGSMAVTYNKHGFDANLGYTFQSERGVGLGFQANNLGTSDEGQKTLDLKVEYRFDLGRRGTYSVWLTGEDLLTSRNEADLVQEVAGAPVSANFFGGRVIKLGFRSTF